MDVEKVRTVKDAIECLESHKGEWAIAVAVDRGEIDDVVEEIFDMVIESAKRATSEKLKLCPFCGGEGKIFVKKGEDGWRDRYSVLCDYENGGCGGESGWYHCKEEAIEAWNRRADDDYN